MNLEKIKALYAQSQEIKQNLDTTLRQTKEDLEENTNKSMEEINKFFNDLVDSIHEDYVYAKTPIGEIRLKNKEGDKYVVVDYRHDTVLLTTNSTGSASRYNKTGPVDQIYFDKIRPYSNYYYKTEFILRFLDNKKEIEEKLMEEIIKSIQKTMNDNVNKMANRIAYIEKTNKYINKEEN